MQERTPGKIQSLKRGLRILELLSESMEPLSVADICTSTGIQRTTLYALINTLISEGYADKDELTGKLVVSSKLFELSCNYPLKNPISVNSRQELMELSEKYSCFCFRVNYFRNKTQVVELLLSARSSLRFESRAAYSIGLDSTLHATASGKLACSCLSNDEICALYSKQRLVRYTAATITDIDVFLAEMARIRERGYATDDGEFLENQFCRAFPIRGKSGAVLGGLGVSGDRQTVEEASTPLIDDCLQRSKLISMRLGWKPV